MMIIAALSVALVVGYGRALPNKEVLSSTSIFPAGIDTSVSPSQDSRFMEVLGTKISHTEAMSGALRDYLIEKLFPGVEFSKLPEKEWSTNEPASGPAYGIGCTKDLKKNFTAYRPAQRRVHFPPEPGANPCYLEFVGYSSSEFEKLFLNNMDEINHPAQDYKGKANWHSLVKAKYCAFMQRADVEPKVKAFLEAMQRFKGKSSFSDIDADPAIFSQMHYISRCKGTIERVSTFIEPLIGILRHPNSICGGFGVDGKKVGDWNIMDIDYIMLEYFKDHPYYSKAQNSIQYIAMDLGASDWASAQWGLSSQEWFMREYERRGVKIDRLIMYEADKKPHEKIWSPVPAEYRHAFQYFNIPANVDQNAPDNPLRILHSIAKVEDYVTWKLDIDTPMELHWLWVLLHDRNARAIIDEFMFEHHVAWGPMTASGWGAGVCGDLAGSYDLFYRLRILGLRAHGWP